jgi:hypothetical protein
MLLASSSNAVADTLADDLVKIEAGTSHDEVKWTDAAVHSCQILNTSQKVVFVAASELVLHKAAINHVQSDGLKIVTVPDSIKGPEERQRVQNLLFEGLHYSPELGILNRSNSSLFSMLDGLNDENGWLASPTGQL